jgi:hypothetical protein
MILNIHDNLLVQDVQERFSECFPNLKIEFYKTPHHWKKESSEDCIDPKTTIGVIRKKHDPGTLEIKSSHTAGEVERNFKNLFDLNVQVFRNENGDWIQTTTTDTCTLNEQKEFSEHAKTSILPKSKKQINEYRFFL